MIKGKLILYIVLAVIVIVALVHGIFLGDPGYMRMEASGL